MTKKQVGIWLIFISALPILLLVYNPSMNLGGLGLMLGLWGTYISPIVIFGFIIYSLINSSKENK